jgi:hypothetical protein
MIFKNFKSACEYYKYPGTHQHGSIGNEKGIFRSYSNGTKGKDFIKSNEILYRLKDTRMRMKFEKNIESGQPIRFFRKHVIAGNVEDLGLWIVASFTDTHVRLKPKAEK